MSTALMIIDAIICVALIASVVMQSGKSAGLSGSIGGGAESLFGGRARGLDQFLARATMILGILFGLVTMALSVIMR
ncbi:MULTISPECIES: preprotein translocase subunit SecG [Sporomusaceae]|uniref:preprotein translocase subunit SecG n=1 Tax=Sporomusaceae TaxID=1843490 RepID=UPI00035F91E9|nr:MULTISPECIES: preprotein translocase subunit SecG [Sporomusaceae]MDD3158165.1 preprotein translocase subunit SecG [Anaeromusa sp.]MEA4835046.1 preprotein translocase subunit SecG [Anaeromusa sp.]NCB75773.1 preprotein translocase subunit SecG [Negativicutes bacterium]